MEFVTYVPKLSLQINSTKSECVILPKRREKFLSVYIILLLEQTVALKIVITATIAFKI